MKKIIVFSILSLVTFQIHAQTARLSEAEIDRKLGYIQAHFDEEYEKDHPWFWGWLAFNATIFTASTTLYFALEKGTPNQQVQPIGMGVATIAITSHVLLRPVSLSARDEIAEIKAQGRDEKLAKLRRAEELFLKAYNRQKLTTGWFAHVGTFAVVLTSGLIEALYYDRVGFGIARFLVSLAIGEYRLYTQPKLSKYRYDKYKAGDLSLSSYDKYPEANLYAGGFSFSMHF